jgi:Holliday junction resolvase-like predicted endonuclease
MINRYQIGQEFEKLAIQWLLGQRNRKIKILTQNYRCKVGEIDLIFEEIHPESGECDLVFLEVRSRPSLGSQGDERKKRDALEMLSQTKQERLRRTIRHYLSKYSGPASNICCDLLYWNGTTWCYQSHLWLAGDANC